MSIVPVLLFCSLALVIGSIVLFVFSAKQGDCHESDRLCLMPLDDDTETSVESQTSSTSQPSHEND